jgi:hypothetical protein
MIWGQNDSNKRFHKKLFTTKHPNLLTDVKETDHNTKTQWNLTVCDIYILRIYSSLHDTMLGLLKQSSKTISKILQHYNHEQSHATVQLARQSQHAEQV